MGKGEIAHNKQFPFFPQYFLLTKVIVSPFVHIFDISLFAVQLEEPKIRILGKGLVAPQGLMTAPCRANRYSNMQMLPHYLATTYMACNTPIGTFGHLCKVLFQISLRSLRRLI